MLEKVKSFFGFGKVNAAAIIREIIKGHESQDILFAPENAQVLAAFVEHGHELSPRFCAHFLETADRRLVMIYLEMGFTLNDDAKYAVINRKDDELVQVMMEAGSWAPFPYSGMVHIEHKHHELEMEAAVADVANGNIVPA